MKVSMKKELELIALAVLTLCENEVILLDEVLECVLGQVVHIGCSGEGGEAQQCQ